MLDCAAAGKFREVPSCVLSSLLTARAVSSKRATHFEGVRTVRYTEVRAACYLYNYAIISRERPRTSPDGRVLYEVLSTHY